MTKVRTVEWKRGRVVMLDQRLLPNREVYRLYRDASDVIQAIKDLVVRGAPAIGVAAAMGLALGARSLSADRFGRDFEKLCRAFAAARPTAVNLFWAIERMRRVVRDNAQRPVDTLRTLLEREALAIYEEDLAANRRLAALRCGAATAALHRAHALQRGRPRDRGDRNGPRGDRRRARRRKEDRGVRGRDPSGAAGRSPHRVGAAPGANSRDRHHRQHGRYFMQKGKIDAVIVGTDRTAANGDVANKIGTYRSPCSPQRHKIPFYVAAPTSSIDLACRNGDKIPIEERSRTRCRTSKERCSPRAASRSRILRST